MPPDSEFSVSEKMPRKGSSFLRLWGRSVNGITRWSFSGEMANEKKLVLALAPHTSNWDFFVGVPLMMSHDAAPSIFMKKEAFFWPFKRFLEFIGFVPINRTAAQGVVEQAADQFARRDEFWLVITPEGTRSDVVNWKKGFLRISRQANVPVQVIGIDYPTKTINFGPVFYASEDLDKDIDFCKQYVSQFKGRR